jgi:peptide deformylase
VIVTKTSELKKRSVEMTDIARIEDVQKLLFSELDPVAERAVGLSAVQIGIHERMFAMKIFSHGEELPKRSQPTWTTFVNPQIVKKSDKVTSAYEGCLSLPHILVNVERHDEIEIVDETQKTPILLVGFSARIFQHELDHLDGVLISDRGTMFTNHVDGVFPIGRNEVCYCGSGKKYKRCHGGYSGVSF